MSYALLHAEQSHAAFFLGRESLAVVLNRKVDAAVVQMNGDADGAGFSKDGDTAGFKAIMICYYSGCGIIVMTNSDNGMSLALEIIRAVERVYGWDSYPKAMM